MAPYRTNGFVNSCPVSFEYNSPACASSLSIHFEEETFSLSIPNSELIALLEQDNGKYVLLFSGDEKKLSGSNVLDNIPNYVPGQLHIITPPQLLIDSLLFSREKYPEWLDITGGRSELTVIVSTGGDGNGKSKAELLYGNLVKPVLKEIGLFEGSAGEVESSSARYNVIYTTSQYSIEEFIKKFHVAHSQRPNQTLLLLSGDTSLFEVLNCLPNPLPPSLPKLHLSLLPTGTGNALCSSLYLQYHPLSSLLLGSPQNLPLFHTQFSPNSLLVSQSGKHPIPDRGLYGAVVLSWAFHASLVADSDAPSYREKYPGTQRFQIAARENLTPLPHLYNGRIFVQRHPNGAWEDLQKELSEEDRGYWYFLATLVSRLEATFLINPLGEPLDGKLRVVHFAKLPAPARAAMEAHTMGAKSIIQAMEAVYDQGKHVELPGVGYERDGVEGVRVQVDEEDYVPEGEGAAERGRERWRRICIDGAIVELQKGGWVEVRRIPEGLEGVKLVWRS
ncbi:hypothetical protein EV426DRAFT_588183 [Tirmania nivea]|nr:hypothetical protein EV426DRAFT_588183 [Tirmania nivea]